MGTLYLVATPIGNLGDITLRSVELLKQVSWILAEDTRRSRGLLSHLGVTGKTVQCLDANASEAAILRVVERLAGEDVALLTDAGTPGISDPGSALVRACRDSEIPVVALPGPSAVTTAVAVSGLVDYGFLFLGFLPRKGGKRQTTIERIAATSEAVVLFESPSRMADTLRDLASLMPERLLCVTRELSKRFEEVVSKPLSEWAQDDREWRGELTLVLGDSASSDAQPLDAATLDDFIRQGLARGSSVKSLTTELLPLAACPRRELYQRVVEIKNSINNS